MSPTATAIACHQEGSAVCAKGSCGKAIVGVQKTAEQVEREAAEAEAQSRDFWIACQVGNLKLVRSKLEEQPFLASTPSPSNSEGTNHQVPPLHWASLNNRWHIARLLLTHGAQPNALGGETKCTALHWAISKGHVRLASLLVMHGALLSAPDGHGYTPLLIAAQHGHIYGILYLLASGVPLEETDSAGRTALLWAAYRGHAEAVSVLISQATDNGMASEQSQNYLCRADKTGRTALHWAAIKGNAEICKRLLEAGAATDLKDCEGKTPLDWAKSKGYGPWYANLESHYRQSSGLEPKFATFLLAKLTPAIMFPWGLWMCSFAPIPWPASVGAIAIVWIAIRQAWNHPRCLPYKSSIDTPLMLILHETVLAWATATVILVYWRQMPSAVLLHGITAISILAVLFLLRRVNTADPGYVRRPSIKSGRLEEREEERKVKRFHDILYHNRRLFLNYLSKDNCPHVGTVIHAGSQSLSGQSIVESAMFASIDSTITVHGLTIA